MVQYLQNLLKAMRPAFSRQATFGWFVVAFAGFVVRSDTFGVSSIVRALWLEPVHYPSLLHFFHSRAWSGDELLRYWRQWLAKENRSYKAAGRIVMIGDHTKLPKDGRRIPAVDTLHQDSETATKPSFFRGHHWGFLGLLIHSGQRFFAAPVWGEIHQQKLHGSRTTRIVTVAGNIAREINSRAYLVLDAFFAVGPVFETAEKFNGWIHIITRAKKNVVAYMAPPRPKKPRKGRPRMYGKKLKLQKLFEQWSHKFTTVEAKVYHKKETVRYLTLDLIWKSVKTKLRFILIETSRGRIILMTSDLTLQPLTALNLYCRRVNIETLFDIIKNLLGGMRYHFWSKYLTPVSRRPAKKRHAQTHLLAACQNQKHHRSHREIPARSISSRGYATTDRMPLRTADQRRRLLLAAHPLRKNSLGICNSNSPGKHHPNEFNQFRPRLDNTINSQEAKHKQKRSTLTESSLM